MPRVKFTPNYLSIYILLVKTGKTRVIYFLASLPFIRNLVKTTMATSFAHNPILSTSLFNHCEFNNRICKFNSTSKNPNQNHQYPTRVRAIKEKTEQVSSPDEVTQKYGLEAGLWKVIPLFFFNVFWLVVVCNLEDACCGIHLGMSENRTRFELGYKYIG